MVAVLRSFKAGVMSGEYAMRGDVARVGSDPACALQLPGLEPHAVTIERREGRFYVYNRTGRSLRLEETPLEPGKSAEWADGLGLRLRSDLELKLAARPGDGGRAPAAGARPEGRASATARDATMIALTIASLVAAAWIVSLRGKPVDTADTSALVIANLQDGNAVDRAAAIEIQLADQAEWFGRESESRAHLGRAGALLADDDPEARDPARDRALEYIAGRLR